MAQITDTDRERIIDQRVQRRLATDRAYRYAEDAEQQAQREDEIEREEVARLDQSIERAAFARRIEAARL